MIKKKWWKEFCVEKGIMPANGVTALDMYEFFDYCTKKREEIHEAMLLNEEDTD